MSVSVVEKIVSPRPTISKDSPAAELLLLAMGSEDAAEVQAAVSAAIPAFYGTLAFDSYTLESQGAGVWEASVRYTKKESQGAGQSSFEFDTSGGSTKITHSLGTVGAWSAAGPPPNYEGAIGVTKDSVEGVEVGIAGMKFAITKRVPHGAMTGAYLNFVAYCTYRVNAAPYTIFTDDGITLSSQAGELLFLGVSGGKRTEEDWELSFRFERSPNANNLFVGTIGPIAKEGHDYLWVRYEDTEDENALALVKRPLAVYVERVYYRANFSGLL